MTDYGYTVYHYYNGEISYYDTEWFETLEDACDYIATLEAWEQFELEW